ncbi:ParB/RepB/Spo0J family partition protein [Sphingomonas lycopersici]|uniref:ParB/RepB/Spo0J family partition protein n=1 Tax=Sphingomonas lycopersici TaxID=2951807 RepID=A0AA42CRF7_9SPHN|nr:ParB/RepB/Spo0J family partition protein [Sphingomonas lycopersici]MCW6536239.1 ParB/RepB/Spo0J family partition protein [Sphingomonas lycopersici]
MAKASQKIVLNGSRDIPFDQLVLSQSNVRRIKAGVSIGELAADIARRTLLQSLSVRPILGEDGEETGRFEVPAGGRRFRALELLVKQKRLAKDAPVPCIVKPANGMISAEEDSFAENAHREPLHPLDQFRAMQLLVDQGSDIEAIAAQFMTTPAVVRQRLKLASVSPVLHAVYAEDGMTLEQLMAFAVSDDHARQEQVFELLAHSYNKSAAWIRQRLTEDSVRAADKRALFVGIDAYVSAGGSVMRDLFDEDDGGWLTDPALLDRLVGEKLADEAERIAAEGWKWVSTAIDLPWKVTYGMREIAGVEQPMTADEEAALAALEAEAESLEAEWADAPELPEEVAARIDAIDEQVGALVDRPLIYEAEEMARAGVVLSIERDGSLSIERGFVRPEDEPAVEPEADAGDDGAFAPAGEERDGSPGSVGSGPAPNNGAFDDDDGDGGLKPLPDRLVADLTAWRTLALQDAIAQRPEAAYLAMLHALVLDAFYYASHETCLQLSVRDDSWAGGPAGLRDSAPAQAIAARHAQWEERLPPSDHDLWEALLSLDSSEASALFAHCVSQAINAQAEIIPKYDNGRVSRHIVERRIAHSHVLARAVGLDLVAAGWRPTASDYFGAVTKQRIIADVTEAKGENFAGMIGHLKKGDMAREAERMLDDAGWLPEPMRTPAASDGSPYDHDDNGGDMPSDANGGEGPDDLDADYAIAAE